MIGSSFPAERKEMEEEEERSKQHFVLVHGIGHGAWCWYKLSALLRSAGHTVTALDLAGSGVHPQRLEEVCSFGDYARPLMEVMASIPQREKVVLVGHSYGGACVALAMERFPEKVMVAVFLAGIMPSPACSLARIVEEVRHPLEAYMDSTLAVRKDPLSIFSISFGYNYLSTRLYQLSPPEVKKSSEGSLSSSSSSASSKPALLPPVGPDAGDHAGETGKLLPRRRERDDAADGGQIRVGEPGVHRVQGGQVHERGLSAVDDPAQPAGGGEADRSRRSHGDAVEAPRALRPPRGDRPRASIQNSLP
ncbi:hypothetical protein GW17_00014808 [Ensete ventricosum]|nr:hypothetical protein GW17_00014808 [Ensete ventricosum]